MFLVSQFKSGLKNDILDLIDNIKDDKYIYFIIAVFVATSSLFLFLHGYSAKISFFDYFYALKLIVPISLFAYIVLFFVKLILTGEKRPLRRFGERVSLIWKHRVKLCSAFLILTSVSIFMSIFSAMKGVIPIVNMFQYDNLFHQIDMWFFFGNQPGLYLAKNVGSPIFLYLINLSYNLWFFFMWAVISYFLVVGDAVERNRFFISWLLCWSLLGIVLATFLSSAGPTFVVRLDPSNHTFSELMQYLQLQHEILIDSGWDGLYALEMQNWLWDVYENQSAELGSGISAMPSMHVSIAILMALSMVSVNKTVGIFLWFFAGIIFIGSFTLGWHYAVDGLVSAPLTYLIWRVCSRLTDHSQQDARKLLARIST